MNRNINNSIPDEMEKIAKKIAAYADGLKTDMKKLLNTHTSMHTSWQGKQYDDFSRTIEEVNKVISKQTEKLVEISIEVKKDAAQLRIAQNSDVG
ncbi:MAG: WXG100 family type VII secretion target [Clostridia bacterium]|nr:WXG100 family type VII secretion target [Clostridia bacterium]